MRILSTVGKGYYNRPDAVEPMYLEFTVPLRALGHAVDHFDHARVKSQLGEAVCGEEFVRQVKGGGYDVVLYQTAGQDWMAREAIGQAKQYAPIIAFNSDDDWQWDRYTRHVYPYFTFMATTYPHIYDANVRQYPNLLLSQWGCLDMYHDYARPKDLGFTFAGQMYGTRGRECRYLMKKAGLRVFGLGAARVRHPLLHKRFINRLAAWVPFLRDKAMPFEAVNGVWNRSRISFTPMAASLDPGLMQIKSRTFEMGRSGTLLLCQHSPNLERYYEPGKEFVPFTDLDDCADKARYYLKNETERAKIAGAYCRRTRAEHMWEHRFQDLFRRAGLERVGA